MLPAAQLYSFVQQGHLAYIVQVRAQQTDQALDNAGSEWEVEWFDEDSEAAELVRHPLIRQNSAVF